MWSRQDRKTIPFFAPRKELFIIALIFKDLELHKCFFRLFLEENHNPLKLNHLSFQGKKQEKKHLFL
jgi:hypothetical protein